MDSFDPYQDWFGIPSQLRPLNHYVLLGIRVFEDDPEKIQAAFESSRMNEGGGKGETEFSKGDQPARDRTHSKRSAPI